MSENSSKALPPEIERAFTGLLRGYAEANPAKAKVLLDLPGDGSYSPDQRQALSDCAAIAHNIHETTRAGEWFTVEDMLRQMAAYTPTP